MENKIVENSKKIILNEIVNVIESYDELRLERFGLDVPIEIVDKLNVFDIHEQLYKKEIKQRNYFRIIKWSKFYLMNDIGLVELL